MTYYEFEAEVPGGLAERMDTADAVLHYEFQGWLGDEVATTSTYWIVTEEVAQALRAASLTGVEFGEVVVTKDEQFDLVPRRHVLPVSWVRMIPTGTRETGDDVVLEDRTQLVLSERALEVLRGFRITWADVRPLDGDASPQVRAFLDGQSAARDESLRVPADPEPPETEGVTLLRRLYADSAGNPVEGLEHEAAVEVGTATVSGLVAAMLAALGSRPGDEAVLRLMPLLSEPVVVASHKEGRKLNEWIKSPWGGVDLRFLNGKFDKVVISLREDHRSGAFPDPARLVRGLDLATAGREELVAMFGDSPREGKHSIEFDSGENYLWFRLLNDRITDLLVAVRGKRRR